MKYLERVHFDSDSDILTNDAKTIIRKNARCLCENPGIKIILEGHCDERGSEEYNHKLGEKRAEAVKNYLVELGLDEKRFKTKSYGVKKPVDPGHNEKAWAKNRRVEFVVEDDDDCYWEDTGECDNDDKPCFHDDTCDRKDTGDCDNDDKPCLNNDNCERGEKPCLYDDGCDREDSGGCNNEDITCPYDGEEKCPYDIACDSDDTDDCSISETCPYDYDCGNYDVCFSHEESCKPKDKKENRGQSS